MNNSILKCYYYKCVATCFAAFILCLDFVCGQCPCEHGQCTTNQTCRCDAGWVGTKCQRPCQDVYKACPYWEKEGRCVWTRKYTKFFLENCPVTCKECIYNLKTIPPGLPLPPYLELLKQLIGEWDLNSDDSINYPVNFGKGGYNKVLRIMLTQVPLFDTPSLNYTGFARSKVDFNDIQEEKGFIWVRPAKSPTREVAYMITTNSGISMLQEGHLKNNYIQLHTVHDANHPYSRCEQPYLRHEHTFSWNDHQLTETFKDDSGRVHFKTLQQQTNCSVSVFAGWRECMDGICFIEEKKKKKKKKKKKNKAETNSCWSVIIARLLLTGLISFVPLSTTQQ